MVSVVVPTTAMINPAAVMTPPVLANPRMTDSLSVKPVSATNPPSLSSAHQYRNQERW